MGYSAPPSPNPPTRLLSTEEEKLPVRAVTQPATAHPTPSDEPLEYVSKELADKKKQLDAELEQEIELLLKSRLVC